MGQFGGQLLGRLILWRRICAASLGMLPFLFILSACGGGGGGGDGTRPFITNAQALPGIERVVTPSVTSGAARTRIYVNDIPDTRHERWVRDVVQRLHYDDEVLIKDYRRTDTTNEFNVFRNYFEQGQNTVTVLPRGYDGRPYLMINYLNHFSRQQAIDPKSLGLLVLSAGNEGISFTSDYDQRYPDPGDRNSFLHYLQQKRSIIAVGTDFTGKRHASSNYCEDWYSDYCVGASYEFTTSDGYYVQGTSFSAPIIGVAVAIMKEQFKLDNDQTFDITIKCARRNPAGAGMVGGVNVNCMFTPHGELYANVNELEGGLSGTDGVRIAEVSASLPPVPGNVSTTIFSVYDSWGRNFGAMKLHRPASFAGTGLPDIDYAKAHQVMNFDGGSLYMMGHQQRPMIGMAFDTGVSIDALISDAFFGIEHPVYEDTKSLRLGYQDDRVINDDVFWGGRVHYTRQHASGDAFFRDVSGHSIDGEVFANFTLPIGEVEVSLGHDIFLGGQFEFLGRSGRIEGAKSSAASLIYALDF